MNLRVENVSCPCAWCRLGDQDSLHRVSRIIFDDKPMSPETQAMLDEIIKDALREVGNAST